ncbi:MAG: hypothetical protein ABIQ90_15055 [Polaromonas sp.]
MKDSKPNRDPEINPSRHRLIDRPDNGGRSSQNLGPSSGAQKDNPHKRLKLDRHAWLSSSS